MSEPETSNSNRKPAKSGVGGWLLWLTIGMVFLGPLTAAAITNGAMITSEVQYPGLESAPVWRKYKTTTWIVFWLFSLFHMYAGICLWNARKPFAVVQARVALWLSGPFLYLVLNLLVPYIVFTSEIFAEFVDIPYMLGQFIVYLINATIWTLYLFRSKRVRNTYYSKKVDSNVGLKNVEAQ